MKSDPTRLGLELRDSSEEFMAARRVAAGLALVSMTSLAVVALYQLGLVKRLPDPPVPFLDAEKVHGSAEAYAILGTPDAVLGLGSYAVTLGLAAMGPANRAQTLPWVPLALGVKAAIDSLQAAVLTLKSWTKFRAFSLFSLITVTATFLTLPKVLPEALAAWREVGKR